MKKNIYQNYTNELKEALSLGRRRGHEKKFSHFEGDPNYISKSQSISGISNYTDLKDKLLFESLQELSNYTGLKPKYEERPGSHPDFSHIKGTNAYEKHYITSMFIDIKNSTGLFKKYAPEAVAEITTTIQRAAIHTCWYFDGYVQRFHGDGLFVYFGGKKTTIEKSVQNALNAASFFTYFVQNDLKNIFEEQGIENIYTRIGIDAGEAEDVVWHLAGIKECSEITTCSLHTSLASKMQSNAKTNGIMVGDNIKSKANLDSALYSIKFNQREEKEERYIFQIPEENFHYTQWEFNWLRYLKNHPALEQDENGNLVLKENIKSVESSLNLNYLRSQTQNYRPSFNG